MIMPVKTPEEKTDTASALLYHPLVRGVDVKHHTEILDAFRLLSVKRQQAIFHVGDKADLVYLLLKGVVKISYFNVGGDEKVIDLRFAGDFFGDMFLGRYTHRIGTAFAYIDCEMAAVPKDALFALMARHTVVAQQFISHIVDEKRSLLARLHALMHISARDRLLATLLALARKQHTLASPSVVLPARITQSDLASLAALNRATANQLIQQFLAVDLITRSRGHLVIHTARVEASLLSAGVDLLE
jgi:CRP-like cAMP-binding protein